MPSSSPTENLLFCSYLVVTDGVNVNEGLFRVSFRATTADDLRLVRAENNNSGQYHHHDILLCFRPLTDK